MYVVDTSELIIGKLFFPLEVQLFPPCSQRMSLVKWELSYVKNQSPATSEIDTTCMVYMYICMCLKSSWWQTCCHVFQVCSDDIPGSVRWRQEAVAWRHGRKRTGECRGIYSSNIYKGRREEKKMCGEGMGIVSKLLGTIFNNVMSWKPSPAPQKMRGRVDKKREKGWKKMCREGKENIFYWKPSSYTLKIRGKEVKRGRGEGKQGQGKKKQGQGKKKDVQGKEREYF